MRVRWLRTALRNLDEEATYSGPLYIDAAGGTHWRLKRHRSWARRFAASKQPATQDIETVS